MIRLLFIVEMANASDQRMVSVLLRPVDRLTLSSSGVP